ncbi:MAG: sensor histidine kinase [Spirochaetota bacterium]
MQYLRRPVYDSPWRSVRPSGAPTICDTPIALITLIDADRQWFKARLGLDLPETGRDIAFCVHAVGTLCVIDRAPRSLTPGQKRALGVLARQAAALLRLQKNRIDLERATQQKNDLLRVVGHDLRNPLTYIAGVSAHLASSLNPGDTVREEEARLLGAVPERARYMTDLVATYLDAQAIEEGAIRLNLESVSVDAVISRVVDDERHAADSAAVRLRVEAAHDGHRVHVDRFRVHQILENLISNAITVSPAGGEVVVRALADHGDLVIEVEDSGPGLEPDRIEELFAPYANSRSGRDAGNHGLGLFVARSLAELHGGSVEAVNREDGGAIFTVRIPGA